MYQRDIVQEEPSGHISFLFVKHKEEVLQEEKIL